VNAELNAAERKQFAELRKSVQQSVNKVLEESGLSHFKNLSNPLYGTQQSVTGSQATFSMPPPALLAVGPAPGPGVYQVLVSFALAQCSCLRIAADNAGTSLNLFAHHKAALRHVIWLLAGAPLSPISENTNSRHWQSTETLRQSKGPATDEDSSTHLDRKASTASRPSTAGTDRSGHHRSSTLRISEQPRPGSGYSGGALGTSALAPRAGDMDSFMEEMLSKERSAFREQHRLKRSMANSRQGLRRSEGARSSDHYGAE
jgi:hypothetical protein